MMSSLMSTVVASLDKPAQFRLGIARALLEAGHDRGVLKERGC